MVTSSPTRVGRSPSGNGTSVHRQHDAPRAESSAHLVEHLRAGYGGGVDADLVGAGAQHGVDVVDGADAPTHGERDEHLVGGAFDHVHHGGATRTRRGDVEERQFVGAFAVVAFGQFDGVAGVAEVLEVDALDDATVVDVEAGNDPDSYWHVTTLSTRRARPR